MWTIKEKTCLITGATSGIGLETMKALALMGARVVFTYRNEAKADKALKYIKEACPSADVGKLYCDFSSFASVRKCADEFMAHYESLHVLINNAGMWSMERKESTDGHEMNFQVNHLSPFLLTNLLMPLMLKSKPARIVNVSSSAHSQGKIHFEDIEQRENWNWFKSYSSSKLANILFTKALSEKLSGSGITVNCLHPGVVSTQLFDGMSAFTRLAFRLIMIPPEKGALTSVYLATSDEVSDISGLYFSKKKVRKSSPASCNIADANKLWKLSCDITGIKDNLS